MTSVDFHGEKKGAILFAGEGREGFRWPEAMPYFFCKFLLVAATATCLGGHAYVLCTNFFLAAAADALLGSRRKCWWRTAGLRRRRGTRNRRRDRRAGTSAAVSSRGSRTISAFSRASRGKFEFT